MPNGNFINTDIFDLLEFDMLELSFEITLFNSFYHPPVKIEMFANCGNCHFRSQFNDCPFKCSFVLKSEFRKTRKIL